ncbi:hypothetical protein D3C79_740650 [compost metagenome]
MADEHLGDDVLTKAQISRCPLQLNVPNLHGSRAVLGVDQADQPGVVATVSSGAARATVFN